jgi:type II secretory pathway predicted ATPase ExeA
MRPLSFDETDRYLHHRLQVAGAQHDVLTEAAVAAVYRATGGVPRLVHTVVSHALFLAAAAGRSQVDASHVAAAARTLDLAVATTAPMPGPEPASPSRT